MKMNLLIESVTSFLENEENKEQNTNAKNKKKSEFDQTKYVPLAMKWLKNKFGDDFNFKHNAKLSEIGRSYHVSVDDKEFIISGKAFDTTDDGKPDTVVFKIEPIEAEEEEEIEKPFD
jgi:hypothetical protein